MILAVSHACASARSELGGQQTRRLGLANRSLRCVAVFEAPKLIQRGIAALVVSTCRLCQQPQGGADWRAIMPNLYPVTRGPHVACLR